MHFGYGAVAAETTEGQACIDVVQGDRHLPQGRCADRAPAHEAGGTPCLAQGGQQAPVRS
eukprot:628574-Pyramimonas_sp.AAC.1